MTAEQAFAALDSGGTATIIGMVPDNQPLQIKGMDLLMGERKLQGSMMGSNQFRTDIPRLLAICPQWVPPSTVMSRSTGATASN